MRIATLILSLISASSLCFGNIVMNGDFETGTFSGWTLSNADPFFTLVDTDLPHSGQFAADLGAFPDDAFLTQLLPTVPGRIYALIYWLQNDGGVPNNFSASWDGVVLPGSEFFDVDGFPYTAFVFTGVPATSSSTLLQFSFEQGPAFWHLDNVSVTAVPEPAFDRLLIAFLAVLVVRFLHLSPAAFSGVFARRRGNATSA
jgi:hypothetical protein